jgi:hypothetical protein
VKKGEKWRKKNRFGPGGKIPNMLSKPRHTFYTFAQIHALSMNIDPELLRHYGAVVKNYHRHDDIFREAAGRFLLFSNHHRAGKNGQPRRGTGFYSGYFYRWRKFWRTTYDRRIPLPGLMPRLSSIRNCWRLPRKHFIELLRDHFDIHLQFTMHMCQRVQQKSEY